MTLDPASRQVRQRISVAPSPATSGTDWAIDAVTDYFLNALEQQTPFKVQVYPQNEDPSKQNSETILVLAYTASTRAGTVVVAEVVAGQQPGAPIDIQEQQLGDGNIPQTEVQVLTLDATGGTYTLTFGANTTAAINWNDNAGTIQTRLQALASIGAGGITVSGTNPFTLTFAGARANQPQGPITADATNLTTGGAGSIAVVHTVVGSGAANDVQTITVTADAGVFTLTFGGNTTAQLPQNATSDAVATELQALASIGAGNVDVQGPDGGPFVVTFQGALGLAAQALITADGTQLVVGGGNEVQTVTVDGDAGTFKLSLDGVNYSAAMAPGVSAATMQTNLQALAAIGANNCNVTADIDLLVYTVTFIGAMANRGVALLVADVSALTQTTVHVTNSQRAVDASTARAIVVGDHVEAALVTPGVGRTTNSTTIASTTTESDVASIVVPGGSVVGRMIRVDMWGTYIMSGGINNDVPRIRLKFAGTTFLDSGITGSVVQGSNANAGLFRFVVELFSYPGSAFSTTVVYGMMEGSIELPVMNVMGGAVFVTGSGYVRTVAAGAAGGHVHYRAAADAGLVVDTTVNQTLKVTAVLPQNSATVKLVTLTAALEIV